MATISLYSLSLSSLMLSMNLNNLIFSASNGSSSVYTSTDSTLLFLKYLLNTFMAV
jgi:hypothetical protein